MHWIVCLFISNVSIMWLEYVYRSGQYQDFMRALPHIIVPILLAQAGLFYGFRASPSLLLAGALFSLMNVLLRVANVYLLGETVNVYTWMGLVCLCLSVILFKL